MIGKADHLVLGDHNAVCYECGRKFKASLLRRHWQGYWVCAQHWEARQPQDFVRALPDTQTPPWVQPMPANVFIAYCSTEGRAAIAGYAVAGCAIAGYVPDGALLLNGTWTI